VRHGAQKNAVMHAQHETPHVQMLTPVKVGTQAREKAGINAIWGIICSDLALQGTLGAYKD